MKLSLEMMVRWHTRWHMISTQSLISFSTKAIAQQTHRCSLLAADRWYLFWLVSAYHTGCWLVKIALFPSILHHVQFSRSIVSDSLWPHKLQHTKPPCSSPEFTQTHVHRVGDAIQPSHPLLSPSPPALNLSQHQGLFQWVSSSHQVANVLEFQLQHQSFQWTPRTGLL